MDGAAPHAGADAEGAPLLDPQLRGAPAPGRRGKRGTFRRAQQAVFARAAQCGLLAAAPAIAALDATGLDARYASTHYRYAYSARYAAAYAARHGGRRPRRPHARPYHPKLTAVFDAASHLIAGAVPGWGPSHDTRLFAPALTQALAVRRFTAVVADSGYDAEANHRVARERFGLTTAIRLNRRRAGRRWPPTPYRRAMRRAFPGTLYAARQQAESGFSQHKRQLGDALSARTPAGQRREMILRVLTHNLRILHHRWRAFQQSR